MKSIPSKFGQVISRYGEKYTYVDIPPFTLICDPTRLSFIEDETEDMHWEGKDLEVLSPRAELFGILGVVLHRRRAL